MYLAARAGHPARRRARRNGNGASLAALPLHGREGAMLSGELAFFVALGFAAQLVDGALGMAYGLIATRRSSPSGRRRPSPARACMRPRW
jgi:hypothetical protein